MNKMRRLIIPIIIALVFTIGFQLLRMGTVVSWTHPKNRVDTLIFANEIDKKALVNKNTLVIVEYGSVLSEKILEKTEDALNFVKKDYSVVGELTQSSLDDVDLLIITTGVLENIGDLEILLDYLDQGGDVLFLSTFSSGVTLNSIKRTFGIYEYGEGFISSSFKIQGGFIGEESLEVEHTPWISQSLYTRLLESCMVYITDKDGNPLLWDYVVGNGRVLVANGNYFAQNGCAGLLVKTVTHFDDISFYPVINGAVFMLEGYPLSMEGNLNWLRTYYSRDIEGFIRDIWWPDMMKIADTYGIKYTAGMYGDKQLVTEAPFNIAGQDASSFAYYGLDLLRQENELAISGYSPVALITEEDVYENVVKWSTSNMDEGLQYMKEFTDYTFKSYEIRSYIAPNGVLTQRGLKSVRKSLNPSIISLALEGNEASQLVKSFDVEANTVWFPIISKGYKIDSYENFLITTFGNSLGVVSHQLSFWQMLFENESLEVPRLWEDITKDYSQLMEQMNDDYNWIDFTTISEAAQREIDQDALDLTYNFDGSNLEVNVIGIKNQMSYMLKTDKKVRPSKAYTIDKINERHYLITASTNTFTVMLEDK